MGVEHKYHLTQFIFSLAAVIGAVGCSHGKIAGTLARLMF